MSPSNVPLPENFIDMSAMPFPLSSMLLNTLTSMLADSPDSGDSSLYDSLISLLNNVSPVITPIRKERKKRSRADFCKLCMKNISEEKKRSQGPSRHVLQYHMNTPKFFCPHCDYYSNYDKAHITTHMRCMHKGLEGEVRITTDPTYAEKFKQMQNRCFGASEEVQKVDVESNSSGSPTRLDFSIESLLASISPKKEVSPPVSPPVTPFQ